MWPDRILNPGPLTYESGALPTALRGPAFYVLLFNPVCDICYLEDAMFYLQDRKHIVNQAQKL